MEVSVVGSQQAFAVRSELVPRWGSDSRLARKGRSRVAFPKARRVGSGFSFGSVRRSVRVPAVRVVARSQVAGEAEKVDSMVRAGLVAKPQLFVGLPLDVISDCNTINHSKAIAAGLKALKLLGADGVELPIWWGLVEKEAMGKYDWSGYLAIAKMIRDNGLKVHASVCFHASKTPAIPLPTWVSSIGDADPDIYFADKEGRRHKECLTFAVDELPVLGGKTPLQAYEDFLRSFQTAFSDNIGSTITGISVGLGPDGELRYPSFPSSSKQVSGVGEFQCYDKHMLKHLKQKADESGNPLWGLSGPHDAPRFDQSPHSNNFFKEDGGSWETPYGDFFLSLYSNQLLAHGERLLSRASAIFSGSPVTISGKIPLMHSWYKTRSHASELTAGYYNTEHRDGYNAVAEVFAKNSCRMVLKGMELSDKAGSCSSPESLLSQITATCVKHGVRLSGENSSINKASDGFGKITENIMNENLVDSFTYQRMGVHFFSPEHWPKFTEFTIGLNRPELHSDDLVSGSQDTFSLSTDTVTVNSQQTQTV